MLAPRDLAVRLVERGLLTPASLVHGGLTLEDASRRNYDVTIARRGRALLFVKQPTDGQRTIEHEAWVYRILRSNAALAAFMPRLRHHEPGLLVLSAVPGQTLAVHAARARAVPRPIAADLGRAVALLHEARAVISGPAARPWILSLAAPPLEILSLASGANLEIIRIVRRSRAICRGLEALGRDWEGAMPLHNDLRLENCVVDRRRRRPALKLVDWELAGNGDPAWDAGSVIAAFTALWLFSLRYVPGMTIGSIARSGTIPLERVRPAVRAFWDSYAAARGLAPRVRAALRARSVRFAAARLLQLAWERTAFDRSPGAEAICTLQAAANMFDDPRAAASTLLGARTGGRRG